MFERRMRLSLAVIALAAMAAGWQVRRVQRSPRSWYVKLRDVDGGKLSVRISDHGSGAFRANSRDVWSVRVNRRQWGGGLDHVVNRIVRS